MLPWLCLLWVSYGFFCLAIGENISFVLKFHERLFVSFDMWVSAEKID